MATLGLKYDSPQDIQAEYLLKTYYEIGTSSLIIRRRLLVVYKLTPRYNTFGQCDIKSALLGKYVIVNAQ